MSEGWPIRVTITQNLMTLASAVAEIFKAYKIIKLDTPRPFQGRFVIDRLGHAMVNLPTKFEVPIITAPITEI